MIRNQTECIQQRGDESDIGSRCQRIALISP